MNIGYVKHKTNGMTGNERKEWFELGIRPPFMTSATFSMHKNQNKKNSNEPDYTIWTNYNRKGENFRGVKVGGLWKKVQRDGITPYFTGVIESPAFPPTGKLNITLFETKVFEGESAADIDWIYDVNWQPYQGNTNGASTGASTGGYTEPIAYSSNPNGGNEIPVRMEDSKGRPVTAEEARLYMD
uniref:DUF736 family protein n=1 Tax=Aliarcobacter sp. TaxID=2321116 RepID=UPI0040489CC5